MRLGFAAQVLGRVGLKSHDSRRWQNQPHLSVSLAYLRDILLYLQGADIHMYRMHSDLAPYIAAPGFPQFHRQIVECRAELEYIGQLARAADIRLSFHADAYTVPNSPDPEVAQRSQHKLLALADILDGMALGREAVVVTHVGGFFDDREAALQRFIQYDANAPESVRRRLALENDDRLFSFADVWRIHQATGIPLVLDRLHFLLNNPQQLSLSESVVKALSTWPGGVAPKIHFSSPRTELKIAPLEASEESSAQPPLWSNHSDYINPFEFIDFIKFVSTQRDFDVLLEAKAKDLAVLRLRRDLARFAPDHLGLR
jgi:UV DNA damage endonuclease